MNFMDCCKHLGNFSSADEGKGYSVLAIAPLSTECHLLGIKYRLEFPAINLITS